MQRNAYVTALGVCLPNAPIGNAEIEDVLGRIKSQPAAVKRRVMMNNGIKSRHYAIDPKSGAATHTNAQLTAEAIEAACSNGGLSVDDIQLLACGTSSADQVIPAHASMVHAELGCPPCEAVTIMGVCSTGVSALNYANLGIAAGQYDNAVVSGSELASPTLRASHFEPQIRLNQKDIDSKPTLAFGSEFLRWMLSDGAGAVLVSPTPNDNGPSLRIDWIDHKSYAHESEPCMYFGMRKNADGSTDWYRNIDNEAELFGGGFVSLAQDVRVLSDKLPPLMIKAMGQMKRKYDVSGDDVDWLLPHYSSNVFRQMLYDALVGLDLEIPYERWFTNLACKGNTGSASIFIMLEELMTSGRAKPGQRILCMVPESSRMLFGFMHFTVV